MLVRHFKWRFGIHFAIVIFALSVCSETAYTQDLAPRAYWPTPQGTNVLTTGYQYSWGDTLTDPSLPIIGVESRINFAQLSYQHTFSLAGRTATAQANLPYTWGKTEGVVEGQLRDRNYAGLADTRLRLSVNLLGAPSMDVVEFQALRAKPRTIIGASIQVQAPTGSYDSDKLINPGTNRWSVKPAFGLIWPMLPTWLVEFEIGAWFFGDNDEFLSFKREQDPILSSEFHLIKRFRPGFWASLDVNYYVGGRTTVNEIVRADLQRNSRIGGTVVFPFMRQHAIRASYSRGVVTESGGDFENIGFIYLYAW